ncbi:MAG: ribonuclease P protein component [Burkholderiales bacterium]
MQRLKSRAQFQAVLAGQTIVRTPHFALHRQDLSALAAPTSRPLPQGSVGAQAWIGAMTPKRWARRAVTRNSIKRQIHNVSAEFETRLAGAAYVVRLRHAFDRAQFVSATSDTLKRAVRSELLQLFDRLPIVPATPSH